MSAVKSSQEAYGLSAGQISRLLCKYVYALIL